MTIQTILFVSGTLLLTGFLGYGTFASAKLLQNWRPDRNLMLLPAENALRILLIGICILLGLASGASKEQLGWVAPAGSIWFPQAVLWGIGIALLFFSATLRLIRRTGKRFYSSVVIEAILPRNSGETIPVLLAMIPAVIVEELLFRSLLIGGFGELIPAWVLLIVTGVLFGLMHSPQGVWGIFGAGMAGLFFGVLFLWYGSIWVPIVTHYVANVLQIGIAMRFYRDTELDEVLGIKSAVDGDMVDKEPR